MTKMSIRTRSGTYTAELDSSPISDELWLSLPYEAPLNMWGDEIYFEVPVRTKVKGDQTIMDVGDIAYWPEARALCLFFGPTPLSADDGRPVSAFALKKIGHLLDDVSTLEHSGDGSKILLERAF